VSVSGTRFATADSIPAKLQYVVRQGYIFRRFYHFRDLTYFKQDMRHLKKWLISVQRHQMLSSCPFFISPSSKMKKMKMNKIKIYGKQSRPVVPGSGDEKVNVFHWMAKCK
jgi:uncharacterized heparinase superfamily protein